MQSPRWLVASVVGVVATIAITAVGWIGICTWIVGPQLFQAAIIGKLKQEPKVCDNVEDRALLTLMGLLSTLLALMSSPPAEKP